MTTHNPTRCAELVRELREDDATLPSAPWRVTREHAPSGSRYFPSVLTHEPRTGFDHVVINDSFTERPTTMDGYDAIADSVARTRNRLAELADRLEAAGVEVEHWRGQVEQMSSVAKRAVDARELLEIERDALIATERRLAEWLLPNHASWSAEDLVCAAQQAGTARSEEWKLRASIRILHSLVDQTDPRCPIGTALTQAGLAQCPDGDAATVDQVAMLADLRADLASALAERDALLADNELFRSVADNHVGVIGELRQRCDMFRSEVDDLRAENERLRQRVRDQDEELQAHAERGHRQLAAASKASE